MQESDRYWRSFAAARGLAACLSFVGGHEYLFMNLLISNQDNFQAPGHLWQSTLCWQQENLVWAMPFTFR
jgi:hypothetical protein